MSATFPQDDLLPIGEVVDGRYRVVRQIGAGGMGAIYEAEQTALGKRFAIKVLRPQLALQGTMAQRFLREARACSQIDHRNVVQISDFGRLDSGAVYYVMEYLEGQDLSQLLKAEGKLPWSRARGIFLQLVSALQAAHDADIIHRDVKPANCYLVSKREVDGSDRVKVLDFGIAKHKGSETNALTGTSEILGTVRYMSPEQSNGAAADARSDIYATGVLMFETLCGRVPFDGDNPFQILFQHGQTPPPAPRSIAPEIPEAVEELVLKALAKKPEDRYGTMHELRLAIVAIDKKGRATQRGKAIVTGETIRASAVHYADLARSGRTVAVPTTGPRHAVPTASSSNPSLPPAVSQSGPHAASASVSSSGPHSASGPHTASSLPPRPRFASIDEASDARARQLKVAAVATVVAAVLAVVGLLVLASL